MIYCHLPIMQVTAPIHNMMRCVFYTKAEHTTGMEQYGVCS